MTYCLSLLILRPILVMVLDNNRTCRLPHFTKFGQVRKMHLNRVLVLVADLLDADLVESSLLLLPII